MVKPFSPEFEQAIDYALSNSSSL